MRGRPSLYSEEMLTLADAYIDQHVEYGDPVPTAAGMAIELGVTKKTLYNWADQHEDFLHMLGKLNDKQERTLIGKGISGEFNSVITKLMLAKQGYTDKQEIEHKGINVSIGSEDTEML